MAELVGVIEKCLFKASDTGYSVLSLQINSHQSVTITGYLSEVHEGSRIEVKGDWTSHPKFGRQFAVETYSVSLPQSVLGIQRYLSSGLIKGIGPKFAERLVDRFGSDTLDVIDKHPERLSQVSGVGEKRIQQIIAAWKDQKEISKVMVFLQEKGVSTAFAAKMYKTYGDRTIDKITENPYRLVDDIWGVGFKSADQLAAKLGFAPTSLLRLQAGIVHCLTLAVQNGHLYQTVDEAKDQTIELLGIDPADAPLLLKHAFHALYNNRKLSLITYENKHYVTLPQYYFSEKGIAEKLRSFITQQTFADRFSIDEIYQKLRTHQYGGIELNDDQQRGILAALQNKCSIITGGPGTGKTTLVKTLLQVLEEYHVKVRLAAPTGRAAKRMFEGTGKPTETIHRLLEFSPGGMGFARNERNALSVEFLIVDEASMIDVFLMHSLLKALPSRAHVLFLGDVDQLPSVGAGNVLNDMIESEIISVTRLTQIFRQAQDSMIIVNAHRVNKGEFPSSKGFGPYSKNDFKFIKQEEPELLFGELRKTLTTTIAKHKLSIDNTVVLTPMNRGIAGTQRINESLQQLLNPKRENKPEIQRFSTIYRLGDRVMQIRNNYTKFVFNGDIGKITAINTDDNEIMITFGDRELTYETTELNEIVLAYAISIHKSQGSEFDAVIIPIFMQHFMLLQRNLIYTGITRAKKLCVLIGQPRAIAMGVRNQKGTQRTTFLQQFLTTDLTARE